MKKILFAASEGVPFIKTGGLADVVGSLPKYIDKEYFDVRVFIPKYTCMKQEMKDKLRYVTHFYMDFNWQNVYVGVLEAEEAGVHYYFIDNESYFGGFKPYGDDPRYEIEKYAYFCKAVLSALPLLNFQPDLIHCHDWQTGLIPVYLKERFHGGDFYRNMKSVITIHNLKFQGKWDVKTVQSITGLPEYYFTSDKLEAYKDANLLKGGIVFADAVTTVSDTYAEEIKTPFYGEGLDGLLRARSHDLRGIVNGIDYGEFNPETDKNIVKAYNAVNFRKEKVKGVSAKVITAAMLGGDCYPATPIGINLPNADWIRKEHGSKSVTIDNITYAYAQAAHGDGFLEEFMLRPEDRERIDKYGKLADDLHTDLHECLGHGSGQLAPGVKGGELKNYTSTLEEARADLFGLYYLGDPKMVELGLIPSLDVAYAEYARYIMNGMMTQLARIEPGKNVEEAHMRNRKLIAEWCYEQGKADNVIEWIEQDGKTYVVVNDYTKLRELLGRMLREVQRIKSEGDFEAGKTLVEKYAVTVDPKLHAEVLTRYKALDIEPYSGFVNPQYELVEKNGKVVDVKVSYPNDYVKQMLEYSRDYSFLPNLN